MGGRSRDISKGQVRILCVAGLAALLGLAALAAAIFYNVVETGRIRDNAEMWRAHTLEVIIAADRLEADLLDRQRTIRGYLVTGDRAFLNDVDFQRVEDDRIRLRALLSDNPAQTARIMALYPLIDVQVARAKNLIRVAGTQGVSEASKIVSMGRGDLSMARTREVIQDVVRSERMVLAQRSADLGEINALSKWYVYAFGLVGVVLLIIAAAAGGLGLVAANRVRLQQISGRLDEEVRMSEERMRLAHEATGIGTWEFMPDSDTILWGPETFTLYGRDPAAGPLSKADWVALVPEEDAALCPWTRGERRVAGFRRNEFRVRLPDGTVRWVVSTAHSFTRNGARSIVGIDVDITERKVGEAELKRLNDLLFARMAATEAENARIFQMAPVLLAKVAGDRLLAVNAAWSDALGYDEPQLRARSFGSLFHPDDLSVAFDEDGSLRCGPGRDVVSRMLAADGSVRVISLSCAMDEETDTVFVAGRDITVQKETESRLRAAEEQVAQLNKMETIGQLTGGVAHDFNNLLTPIVGSLDLLKRKHSDDERSQRWISSAQQSAERARVLVSRLLAFARRQHLEAQVVDVGRLIGGIKDLVCRSLGPRIEVRMDVPRDLPDVKVDPNQLELAILNLSVNARDAMPDGGSLSIRLWRRTVVEAMPDVSVQPGEYVVICVSDTGVGMDPKTLQRAIEPFYSTKGVGKGTGLGLSMVHGLAAQSGGALALASQPGEGTTASLWLPVAPEGETARTERQQKPPITIDRSLSVLVVDDEELVRTAVAEILAGMGHSVVQAASGAAALSQIAAGTRFDLMVTDHMMPTMTGLELIQQVRTLRPDLKVLLVTGYSNLAAQEDEVGVPRLAKPFGQADLAVAIAEIIEGDKVVRLSSRRSPASAAS